MVVETSETQRAPSRIVSAVVVGVAIAVVVAVASLSGGSDEPTSTPVTRATTTSLGQDGAPATVAPGEGTTPEGAIDAPRVGTDVPLEVLGPLQIPRSGDYRYQVVEVVDGERRERTDRRVVERVLVDDRTGLFRVTTRRDDTEQTEERHSSDAGRFVVGTTLTTPFGTTRCEWNPAWPVNGPLAPAQQWSYESQCVGRIGEAETTLRVEGAGIVRSAVQISVSGDNTPVWLIESVQTLDVAIDIGTDVIRQSVEESRVDYLDPLRGIVVRSDATSTLRGENEGTINRTELFIQFAAFG